MWEACSGKNIAVIKARAKMQVGCCRFSAYKRIDIGCEVTSEWPRKVDNDINRDSQHDKRCQHDSDNFLEMVRWHYTAEEALEQAVHPVCFSRFETRQVSGL